MKLDINKELAPIIFNENSIKLSSTAAEPDVQLFPPHWHERIEFILVEEGSLVIHLSEQTVEYLPGDIAVLCPKQIHHGISGKNGVKYRHITLDLNDYINNSVATIRYIEPILNSKILFSSRCNSKELYNCIMEIAELTKTKNAESILMIQSKIFNIFALLYKYCYVEQKSENTPNTKLSNIIKFIDSHFSEQLTTSALSEKFGYDESYFCRKFKAVTGLPVMTYIKILRLEQAQELLKSSSENVHNIAALCGFADHCYFTRSFRNYFHCTPSEFRQNCHKGKEANK
ncbi:MAG: helix-turn-helix transcriptional regulator [Clostridia bacterium]|nr:helix-turn-helix transcriptional regulator [Clostridia bacterium]